MNGNNRKLASAVAAALVSQGAVHTVTAQEQQGQQGVLEELVVTGSRLVRSERCRCRRSASSRSGSAVR